MNRKSVPNVTKLLLLGLSVFSFINAIFKYYTYFTMISTLHDHDIDNDENSHLKDASTGKIPHPHDLYVPFLTFIPTKSNMLLRPWVFITSSLIDEGIISFTVSFLVIFYIGRYLETLWSSKELLKYTVFNMVSTNIGIIVYYFIRCYFNEDVTLPNVFTTTALIIALIVGVKQRIPNHYLLFFKGNLRLKISSLPFIILAICYAVSFINFDYYIMFQLGVFSLINSWIYLRFYKEDAGDRQLTLLPIITKQRDNSGLPKNIRGDRTEQFSLYTFFPYPFTAIVKAVFSVIFVMFAKLGILDVANFKSEASNDENLDTEGFNSSLFGLSSLKGVADDISALPIQVRIKNFIVSSIRNEKPKVRKSEIDKRRKEALNEIDRRFNFE